jgi:hypothetical protein
VTINQSSQNAIINWQTFTGRTKPQLSFSREVVDGVNRVVGGLDLVH